MVTVRVTDTMQHADMTVAIATDGNRDKAPHTSCCMWRVIQDKSCAVTFHRRPWGRFQQLRVLFPRCYRSCSYCRRRLDSRALQDPGCSPSNICAKNCNFLPARLPAGQTPAFRLPRGPRPIWGGGGSSVGATLCADLREIWHGIAHNISLLDFPDQGMGMGGPSTAKFVKCEVSGQAQHGWYDAGDIWYETAHHRFTLRCQGAVKWLSLPRIIHPCLIKLLLQIDRFLRDRCLVYIHAAALR